MALASRLFRRVQRSRVVALLETLGLLAFTLVVAPSVSPAQAYEYPTGTWSASVGNSSNVTYPGGVQVTVASTGLTAIDGATTLGARGFDQTHFTPTNMVTGDTAVGVTVNTGGCASTGTCASLAWSPCRVQPARAQPDPAALSVRVSAARSATATGSPTCTPSGP